MAGHTNTLLHHTNNNDSPDEAGDIFWSEGAKVEADDTEVFLLLLLLSLIAVVVSEPLTFSATAAAPLELWWLILIWQVVWYYSLERRRLQ